MPKTTKKVAKKKTAKKKAALTRDELRHKAVQERNKRYAKERS